MKNFYRGKAKNISYSKTMFLTLVTQHAIDMRHIAIWGLSGSTIFFSNYFEKAEFSKKIYLT
jgi:hypothetical protein